MVTGFRIYPFLKINLGHVEMSLGFVSPAQEFFHGQLEPGLFRVGRGQVVMEPEFLGVSSGGIAFDAVRPYQPGDDVFEIPRIGIAGTDSLEQFTEKLHAV